MLIRGRAEQTFVVTGDRPRRQFEWRCLTWCEWTECGGLVQPLDLDATGRLMPVVDNGPSESTRSPVAAMTAPVGRQSCSASLGLTANTYGR